MRLGHNPLTEVVRDCGLLRLAVFVACGFFLGHGGCECMGGEHLCAEPLPLSFDFHASWPSHAFTSSLTTASTRRSRPSRPNTALPLQSGPSGSPSHRAVASSSHCQHMEPKGIQVRSRLPGSRLLSRGYTLIAQAFLGPWGVHGVVQGGKSVRSKTIHLINHQTP